MGGTYHWATKNVYVPWPTGSGMTVFNEHIDIPGGSTLKKILCNNSSMRAWQTGQEHTAIGIWNLSQEVYLTGGDYDERRIYRKNCAIPGQILWSDPLVFPNRFTNYLNAGDDILGFNEQVNYGNQGPGAGDFQVHCLMFTIMDLPYLSNVIQGGWAQLAFRALYFTPGP